MVHSLLAWSLWQYSYTDAVLQMHAHTAVLLCILYVCVHSFAIFLVSLGLLGLSLVVGQEFQKLVRSGKVL
jgi:hypothetical protein